MRRFPLIQQLDIMDCGPTCLQMICLYYGNKVPLPKLRNLCSKGQQGVTLYGLSQTAEELGFHAQPLKMTLNVLVEQAPMPCIVHWKGEHFVVVYKTSKSHVHIADPSGEKLKYTHGEFKQFWSQGADEGIVLLLEPTPQFAQLDENDESRYEGVKHIFSHLFKYKNYLVQLGFAAMLGTLLNLIFPFCI